MKKLLLLLLLIAALWGFYQGADDSSQIQPTGRPEVSEKASSGAAGKIGSFFRTMVSGMSDLSLSDESEQAPEAEADARTDEYETEDAASRRAAALAAAMMPDSLGEFNLRDLIDFQDSLEQRIDRSAFVPSAEIPQMLKHAVISAEDRRFYEHGAIDVLSIGRAAVANYMAGETVEGGSTISQQTVKNLFLSPERTTARKVMEFFLALQLEKYYTKDEILEIYLNTIYFGQGAYGVGEASRVYFGKEPKELSLSECALIAGLPQAPSAYNPIDHPEAARKRTVVVLMLMAREGYITAREAAEAGAETVFSDLIAP